MNCVWPDGCEDPKVCGARGKCKNVGAGHWLIVNVGAPALGWFLVGVGFVLCALIMFIDWVRYLTRPYTEEEIEEGRQW